MKRSLTILFILFLNYDIAAQKIETIVPKQAVVIGTAFQVQYVISNPSDLVSVNTPNFNRFSVVSGPNHYKGNAVINGKLQPIENITYTLVPLQLGTIEIKGINGVFKNEVVQSTGAMINVVSKPKASFSSKSSYTDVALYAPALKADLDKLVNENIFIRAEVSKKTCYVGEAIIASFKLYSRLQSSSELVRVPGLYGFSVLDILDIDEAHLAVETIGGKVFNTSVLRKVQLYPEQAGELVIDEMRVENLIEFDDSLKKGNKKIVHKTLRTEPIIIKVKPLPARRANYGGAVGKFAIAANLVNENIEVADEGKLFITISGKGNFIQLGEPSLQWPKGLDVFEPIITDELKTAVAPVEGKRTYTYRFTADSIGNYTLPSINFTYFDPASDSFKTSTTDLLKINILSKTKGVEKNKKQVGENRTNYTWFLLAAVLVAMIGLILVKFKRKKPVMQLPVVKEPTVSISQKIEALVIKEMSDKQACLEISKLLSELLKAYPAISEVQKTELESIKSDCQLLAYSSISAEGQKEELRARTLKLAQQLEL